MSKREGGKRKQFERKQVERGVEVSGHATQRTAADGYTSAERRDVLLHSPPRHLPGSELFPGDSSTDVLFEWGKHKVALGAIIQY